MSIGENVMSFVLFAGCKYFGIMIGDRRCSSFSGEIISDNVTKVIKINPNLVVGASGDEDINNLIIEYLKMKNNINFEETVTLLKENYSLIYSRLFELAKKQGVAKENDVISNMGIMSCCDNVIKYANIYINKNDIEITIYDYPSTDDISFCYLADGLNGLKNEFEKNFYKNKVFSITNIKSAFYKTLKENCKNDYTINDRFTMECIVRSDIYDEKRDRCK